MLSGHLNVFCEPYPCGLWENSLPEVVTASGQFPRKPPLSVEGRLSFASLGFYQDWPAIMEERAADSHVLVMSGWPHSPAHQPRSHESSHG